MGKHDFLANKDILLWCILLYRAIPYVNDPVTHKRAVTQGRNTREWEYVKTLFPDFLTAVRWCHTTRSGLTSYCRNPRAAEINRLFADNFKLIEWFNPSQARRQNLMCGAAWIFGLQPVDLGHLVPQRGAKEASKKWLIPRDVLT